MTWQFRAQVWSLSHLSLAPWGKGGTIRRLRRCPGSGAKLSLVITEKLLWPRHFAHTHILIFITIWLAHYKWGKQFKCLRELCCCFSVDWMQKLGYQPNPGLRVKVLALYPGDEDEREPCLRCFSWTIGGKTRNPIRWCFRSRADTNSVLFTGEMAIYLNQRFREHAWHQLIKWQSKEDCSRASGLISSV